MGRSYTYHLLGYAKNSPEVEVCMNKVEMVQLIHKYAKRGIELYRWSYQTETGRRSLGLQDSYNIYQETKNIKLPKLVACPFCNDQGCFICNYSGVCPKNHWMKWQQWQLEQLRDEIANGTYHLGHKQLIKEGE